MQAKMERLELATEEMPQVVYDTGKNLEETN